MTKELSRRLRRARRSEIVPIYYGIKRAVDRAIASQPETITLVSVEKDVWEIMSDSVRVGGVIGSFNAVKTATRLIATKMGCEMLEEDTYIPMTDVYVAVFQLRMYSITPLVAKIVERRTA